MQYYDKNAVGVRIKSMRKNKNMTQYELASFLDYSNERQLQRIENGETACSIDKLMEIAQILETSTDYLLFGMEIAESKIFTELFKEKTEGQKLFLCRIIKTVAENMELLM